MDWNVFLSALAAYAGGAATTVLVFRARLDVADAKFSAYKEQLAIQRAADIQRADEAAREIRAAMRELRQELRDSRRREEFLIELSASIAKKAGVRHRITDAVASLAPNGGDDDDEPRTGTGG